MECKRKHHGRSLDLRDPIRGSRWLGGAHGDRCERRHCPCSIEAGLQGALTITRAWVRTASWPPFAHRLGGLVNRPAQESPSPGLRSPHILKSPLRGTCSHPCSPGPYVPPVRRSWVGSLCLCVMGYGNVKGGGTTMCKKP